MVLNGLSVGELITLDDELHTSASDYYWDSHSHPISTDFRCLFPKLPVNAQP